MDELLSHADGQILEFRWATDLEIHRFPFWAPCYLINGLLIDTGAPEGVKEYSKFLKNHEITHCVLTHSHEDHAGNAHILNSMEIPVFAHAAAVPLLASGYSYPEYRAITWGSEVLPAQIEPLSKQELTTSDEEYRFSIIPMPGHAPDLIVLLEKNKQWVFVADAVAPKYTQIFNFADPRYPKGAWIQEDIAVIYQSIHNLYQMTQGMVKLQVFTQLGGIQPRSFLRDKLMEIEALHKESHKLRDDGLTEEEILIQMFNRESFVGIHSSGHLSRKNLVKSLLKWSKL
jgi:glyoxylase-like metal-dependent hydrolase (beta-lactamase superfamily II)